MNRYPSPALLTGIICKQKYRAMLPGSDIFAQKQNLEGTIWLSFREEIRPKNKKHKDGDEQLECILGSYT